ncbi:MAG: UbiD family decarboxylase [Burkholderiaceae bacterium]|nr:UbiD family decarboxylase [Burkholderiaceae bacterium]
MIERDLRTYLQDAARAGELLFVDRDVDPATEAPGLIKRSIEREKIVLFRSVAGRSTRVVANTLGSRRWLSESFGCGTGGLVSRIREHQSRVLAPELVASAPVKEVVARAVDLRALPILTMHEGDAGPYITGGIGIQLDPESGRQNAGYYSLQLKGSDRLGLRMLASTQGYEIFQRRLRLGLRTEMAVAIGLHPVEMIAAATHTLLDEFALAGGIRGEPVKLVKCERIDVSVPAYAEIVLEGTILADDMEPEGPIGDWLGYYPLVEARHILKIEQLTCRRNPIYQTILPGSAEENLLLAIPREADVLRAARRAVPGVRDVSLHPFLPVCVIQLTKAREGEPMNAILAAFGEVPFIKICIAVDEDVDLHDARDVLWAIVTRAKLDEDLEVIRNVLGFSRDPHHRHRSKLAVDATAPLEHREHFRRTRVVSPKGDLDAYLARHEWRDD